MIKKCVHVVNIGDNYLKDLKQITLPNILQYAERIGADVNIITQRKFPEWPMTYEKMQVYEDGKGYDWNVLIDLDTLIHPDFCDVTMQYPKSVVSFNFAYNADTQLRPDKYFARDGRNVGVATNFVVTSDWTHDLWEPLDISVDVAKQCVVRHHITDEYCISRNLAKYGMKYAGIAPTPETQQLIFHIGAESENEQESVVKAVDYIKNFGTVVREV